MLFCVTTRGRERIFSSPRDSAMVSTRSIRMLLVALTKERPLVGPFAGKFENSGINPLVFWYKMLLRLVLDGVLGELPTACAPPIALGPLPQPKPNCVAKLRGGGGGGAAPPPPPPAFSLCSCRFSC